MATATPRRLRELRATRMAMVFQEPMTALNPVHTVGKQVDEVLRLHRKMSAAERRAKVLEMFRSVHLPDVERIYDAYPHQLSGGQRQRIVIAMALILEPRLLIADEPTTALDVTTQKQILALIKELQVKHKTAVLFITHDFGVVAEISDRIIVMNRGDLVKAARATKSWPSPAVAAAGVLGAQPGAARRAPAGQPVLHVKVWAAPTAAAARCSRASGARRGGRGRRQPDAAQGRDPGHRGRVRLRQVHGRALHRAPDRATAGHMMMGGEDLSTLSGAALRPVRRRIQIVFQDPYRSLNPRRTVGESIIEGLLNFGVPREQALRRAGETLSVVGLSPTPCGAIRTSSPAASASASASRARWSWIPRSWSPTRPCRRWTSRCRRRCWSCWSRCGSAPAWACSSSPTTCVAAQICDTIIVMQRGKVVETGSAETVLTEPRHEYTRALIDAAPGRDWDFRNFRPVAAGHPAQAPAG